MNFVVHSPGATRHSIRPVWLAALGWFTASVASIALAVASMPAAGWESPFTSLDPATPLLPPTASMTSRGFATEDPNLRSPARCPTCGIVVNIRTLPLAGTAPPVYELTVRFRDGSRRLSNHSDDGAWRVGDSIMLMGGTKVADR